MPVTGYEHAKEQSSKHPFEHEKNTTLSNVEQRISGRVHLSSEPSATQSVAATRTHSLTVPIYSLTASIVCWLGPSRREYLFQ